MMEFEEGRGWAWGILFVPDEGICQRFKLSYFYIKNVWFGRGRFARPQFPVGLL